MTDTKVPNIWHYKSKGFVFCMSGPMPECDTTSVANDQCDEMKPASQNGDCQGCCPEGRELCINTGTQCPGSTLCQTIKETTETGKKYLYLYMYLFYKCETVCYAQGCGPAMP